MPSDLRFFTQASTPGPVNDSKTLHWNLRGAHKNPGCTAVKGCVASTTHPSWPGTFQVLKQKVSCPTTLLSSGQTGTVSHSTVVGGMLLFEVLEVQLELQTSLACPW